MAVPGPSQERSSGAQEQGRDRSGSGILRNSLSEPLYFQRSSIADPEYTPAMGRPRGMVTPQVNVAEGARGLGTPLPLHACLGRHPRCGACQLQEQACLLATAPESAIRWPWHSMQRPGACLHALRSGVSLTYAPCAGATHVSTADFPMPVRHSMMEPAIFDEVQPEFNRKLN